MVSLVQSWALHWLHGSMLAETKAEGVEGRMNARLRSSEPGLHVTATSDSRRLIDRAAGQCNLMAQVPDNSTTRGLLVVRKRCKLDGPSLDVSETDPSFFSLVVLVWM